jgi:hypothetical protein
MIPKKPFKSLSASREPKNVTTGIKTLREIAAAYDKKKK